MAEFIGFSSSREARWESILVMSRPSLVEHEYAGINERIYAIERKG
jgi:hypothetical protein